MEKAHFRRGVDAHFWRPEGEEQDVRKVPLGEGSGCYRFFAHRDFEEGEELFLSYGRHDNMTLLEVYGFSMPDNPFDTIQMDLPDLDRCSYTVVKGGVESGRDASSNRHKQGGGGGKKKGERGKKKERHSKRETGVVKSTLPRPDVLAAKEAALGRVMRGMLGVYYNEVSYNLLYGLRVCFMSDEAALDKASHWALMDEHGDVDSMVDLFAYRYIRTKSQAFLAELSDGYPPPMCTEDSLADVFRLSKQAIADNMVLYTTQFLES
uniref:SET domain-containing protein n=1 Tax=Palpitomonas bilix TaxID=652834 RepID=A0A7S3G4Q2_9EUKA|mmetsp:Transcript_25565/g.64150  ORF Transcript_25565/g.64150 Transcript_25565/m.64150 type:complete len:265 (+) Transcript_25565:160-954(+)